MFAERIVGAERTGFLPAVVAVLVQLVASALTSGLSSSIAISAIVSIIVGSFVYAFVLGTTFLKGLFIGIVALVITVIVAIVFGGSRSEEHTSELQSLMRISYAVFCLKNKNKSIQLHITYLNVTYIFTTNRHI